MHTTLLTMTAAGSVVLSIGCTAQLPAPEVPHDALQTLPEMPPSKADEGHIVVDVQDANAHVDDITGSVHVGRWMRAEETRVLCVSTPCGASLLRGDHVLRVTTESGETEVGVRVTDKPNIVRVVPAERRPSGVARVLGILAIPVGGAATVAGACTLAVGVGTNDNMDKRSMFEATGTAILIGGVVTTIVGIILTAVDRPALRRSAFAQWAL